VTAEAFLGPSDSYLKRFFNVISEWFIFEALFVVWWRSDSYLKRFSRYDVGVIHIWSAFRGMMTEWFIIEALFTVRYRSDSYMKRFSRHDVGVIHIWSAFHGMMSEWFIFEALFVVWCRTNRAEHRRHTMALDFVTMVTKCFHAWGFSQFATANFDRGYPYPGCSLRGVKLLGDTVQYYTFKCMTTPRWSILMTCALNAEGLYSAAIKLSLVNSSTHVKDLSRACSHVTDFTVVKLAHTSRILVKTYSHVTDLSGTGSHITDVSRAGSHVTDLIGTGSHVTDLNKNWFACHAS
jgi:hypothetical protein